MTERKPSDDLKEGLGLLFRAARGLAKGATTESAEKAVSDGARELVRIVNDVGRALGSELEKSFGGPPKGPAPTEAAKTDVAPAAPSVPPEDAHPSAHKSDGSA